MIKVGDKLREERIKKGLSLEDVSKETKIRANFLEHIEEGEYEKLPSASIAQGFVRNYVAFLGLPEEHTMAIFRREFDEEKITKLLPPGLEREEFSLKRINLSQILIVAVLFLLLFGFLGIQYKDAFLPPSLSVAVPKEKQVINKTTIEVSGKTDPDNTIFVNDSPVALEKDGSFKKTLTLFLGENEIDIKAVNRFGKTSEVKRIVEVK